MLSDIFDLQNPWRFDAQYEFKYFGREILADILGNLENDKIIGLVGSRQVGKSSLLYMVIDDLIKAETEKTSIFYFNLDDMKLRELFSSIPDFIQFLGKTKQRKYVFVDEVQRLEFPGLFLKEVHDLRLNIKFVYSGSSQLEMKSKMREHLVGRARQFTIHRLSLDETFEFQTPTTRKESLFHNLIYGSYPEVVANRNTKEKKLLLKDIYQSYLEKDIVDYLQIRNVDAYNKLLVLLAGQVGHLLSIQDFSRELRISRKEVETYVRMLEDTFMIKLVYPFHKNYKKEITKTPKIYFLDIGMRNFLLNRLNEDLLKDDWGRLFENFCLLQYLAKDSLGIQRVNYWRTTNQTEIDFVVENESVFEAIEVKWSQGNTPRSFKTFSQHYPNIKLRITTRHNFI